MVRSLFQGATCVALVPAVILFVMTLVSPVSSEVIELHRVLRPGNASARGVFMFSRNDTPAGTSQPYIELDATAVRVEPTDGEDSTLTAAIFPESVLDRLVDQEVLRETGVDLFSCCTQALIETGNCTRVGDLVAREDTPWLWSEVVRFDAEAPIMHRYNVSYAGFYRVVLVSCFSGGGPIDVEYTIAARNPYGYLPGQLYAMMPFVWWLTALYAAMLVVWIGFCIRFREDLLPLQMWIGAVVAVSIVEMMSYGADLERFNATGHRSTWLQVIHVGLSIGKQALGRFLVLVVCMGYGVARPTLVGVRRYLVGVISFFAIASMIAEIEGALRLASDDVGAGMRIFLIFPQAVADSLIFLWIFTALRDTTEFLAERRQAHKLAMYARFSGVLTFSLVASCVFLLVKIVNDSVSSRGAMSRHYWVFLAFPMLLTMMIIVAVCAIWRPNENNRLYAYAEEIGSNDMDDMDYGDGGSEAGYGGTEMIGVAASASGHRGGVMEDDVMFTLGGGDDDDDDESF